MALRQARDWIRLKEKLLDDLHLTGDNRKCASELFKFFEKWKESNGAVDTHVRQRSIDVQTDEKPPLEESTSKDIWTIEDTIHWMTMQLTLPLSRRDHETIEQCFHATFIRRRKFIVQGNPSVEEVKELYPILFQNQQIISELEHITTRNIAEKFYHHLRLKSKLILKCQSTSHEIRLLVNKKRKTLEKGSVERKYIESAGALLLLPSLFHERIRDIVFFNAKKPKGPDPVILCRLSMEEALSQVERVSFEIYVEKTLICRAKKFTEAMLIYVAVFYIFHLQFSAQSIKTLTLITTIFMKLKAESLPVMKEVKRVFSKLSGKVECNGDQSSPEQST